MIGMAIFDILTTDANVYSAIGLRCFPNLNPLRKDEFPYIVYTHAGDDPHDTKNAVSTLNTALVEISIYHKNMLNNEELAQDVRQAIDRQSGTFQTVVVQSVQYQNQTNQFEFEGIENEDGLFLISQTYKIRYEPEN